MADSARPMVEILPGVQLAAGLRVKVTRVLVFEGPVEWVKTTLDKRWLHTKGNVFHENPDTENYAGEDSLVLEVR